MANTYTQIHIHSVFSVKNRKCLIAPDWQDELYQYMTGIIQNHNHKVLAINGMPDHVHILFGMRPSQSLSELMQDVKGSSSLWINQKGFIAGKFAWQEGYGAFSYAMSDINRVVDYIKNQQKHHLGIAFHEEYRYLLKIYRISFDERYIFHSVD
jgi:putative transposase